MQLHLNGIQTEFLENAIEFDLFAREGKAVGFESVDDLVGSNAAVQMSFVVGVGFDIDRLFADLVGQRSQRLNALLFDFLKFGAMLLDHPLVVIVGDDRESFGEEVVVGVAGLDFDDITRLAKVLHILDQHQLDAAVGAFGKTWELGDAFLGRSHGSCSCDIGSVDRGVIAFALDV